ncbi:MAG: class I SAM-dependent methyltransferase, partial [Bacteroidales bacterium]|nr:class I SAM-dependent methyltransferase [Bacteroidales bacterium]
RKTAIKPMKQRFNTPSVRTFINEHLYADTLQLALQKSPFPDIPIKDLLVQIEGKRKAKEKIPSFFQMDDIVYPPSVSMEQCSSEQTAIYKASLCRGERLIDLTGGFGVDSWMFSKTFKTVVYCEKNEELADIARQNFSALQTQNIDVQYGDGLDFLKHQKQTFDWIYIDPSRRDLHNRKMYTFSDCTPNVVENQNFLFQYSERIMIKSSPMLDIDKAILELKQVEAVHIIAVKNEVREVLYLLKKGHKEPPVVVAVNIGSEKTDVFSFSKEEQQSVKPVFSMPLTFLYEPNAAVMKSGAFNLISARFNIFKLHKNSHLYTSNDLIPDFPGRIFTIKELMPYKPAKNLSQANISVRNFPVSPDEVRKKLKLRDGGDVFLFCTTLDNEKPIIIWCEKIVPLQR